ncbi:pimeloyl-ACP methyl ester esterase BioH [uncultured Ferrimonas sp.]|uniref:pimeloyl-ACP methyl ester esterase BioH n=1 Tax=uncultured Ferrimonas sp. TaxID=432640 RepID=UPI002636BDF2|nr:pimeloyl-ACP methyl ester esterase BioH [uncultured Ferrimonas sp.]
MSHNLTASAVEIHWHGQGPALLLLHGWGMNGAVWQQLVPSLQAQGLMVGVAQLPGFGGTAPLASSDDIELLAAAIWAQLPPDCHLLGWSLGGLVAQQMALLRPERTLSLCTLASSPCFEQRPDWPGIAPAVLAGFATQLQQDSSKTINGFFALQGMGSVSGRADVRQLKQAVMALPAAHPTALAGGLTMLAQVDLRAQLATLQLPWLRIYGHNDALVPRASVALVDQLAPQSQSVLIPQAGHAPFISHFELTCAQLVKFYLAR